MPQTTTTEEIWFPWENLDGDYRTFEGEKLPNSGDWDEGASIVPDEKTGKWKLWNQGYGTGSPWYVDEDVDEDATTITVHEQPYIRLVPPVYRQRGDVGMLTQKSNLIGDFGENNSSLRYAMESTSGTAKLNEKRLVVYGTKGSVYFNSDLDEIFVPVGGSIPSGYSTRGNAISTSIAQVKGDRVNYFLQNSSVSSGKPSVYEADGTVRLQSDLELATPDVSAAFYVAAPISGGPLEEYSLNTKKLFTYPKFSVTRGTIVADMPSSDLFAEDSSFLASPVFIFKSRTEAHQSLVTHWMVGLTDETSGDPVFQNDFLTIPSLAYYSPAPNTVTRSFLNSLMIGKYIDEENPIPERFNSDGDMKSCVWSFAYRGLPIPATNEIYSETEEITGSLNFFRGEPARDTTAPTIYRATNVDGEPLPGLIYINSVQYGFDKTSDYSFPYYSSYHGQTRNGSWKKFGYYATGSYTASTGLTGVTAAGLVTRHRTADPADPVSQWVGRVSFSTTGQWSFEPEGQPGLTKWYSQHASTSDRLLPGVDKDAFIGDPSSNGYPIGFSMTASAKDGTLQVNNGFGIGPLPLDTGVAIDGYKKIGDNWFSYYINSAQTVWQGFNPAQPFPYSVRKIKCRLANPPLDPPKPEEEMLFESDFVIKEIPKVESVSELLWAGDAESFFVERKASVNSTYVEGEVDMWATFPNTSIKIGVRGWRDAFVYFRGLFWIESPVEGDPEKKIRKYIVERTLFSDHPVWKTVVGYSDDQNVWREGRTGGMWRFIINELPSFDALGDDEEHIIHYQIEMFLEKSNNYQSNYYEGPYGNGYIPNLRYTWSGTLNGTEPGEGE